MRKLFLATSAVLFVTSAVAFGQSAQPAPEQQKARPARDPNEIICERQEELGSRIASARVCKTRAQWAEDRRTQRQDVEKAQVQRDLSH